MNLYQRLRDWAGRVERDEAPHPVYFRHRAARLVRRGLLPEIADEVHAAGDTRIMRSIEGASDADLVVLNDTWRKREAALTELSDHAGRMP